MNSNNTTEIVLKSPWESEGLKDLKIVDAAKILRLELAVKIPSTKFSVRVDRYSMDESIDVKWTNGVATFKVQALLWKYEDISRDARGNTLSGGNRYVQAHRSITEDVREPIFAEFDGTTEKYHKFVTAWEFISKTDFLDGGKK